jgi:hypothetical protein
VTTIAIHSDSKKDFKGSFGSVAQQINETHRDLRAFQAKTERRFAKMDASLDKIGAKLDKVENGLDLLYRRLRSLRADMPKIIGSAVRDALGSKRK